MTTPALLYQMVISKTTVLSALGAAPQSYSPAQATEREARACGAGGVGGVGAAAMVVAVVVAGSRCPVVGVRSVQLPQATLLLLVVALQLLCCRLLLRLLQVS